MSRVWFTIYGCIFIAILSIISVLSFFITAQYNIHYITVSDCITYIYHLNESDHDTVKCLELFNLTKV